MSGAFENTLPAFALWVGVLFRNYQFLVLYVRD